MNSIIFHGLSRAGIPSTKEPVGLSRSDGKRPDGVTQIPWQNGKLAVWDVTVADTLATSYIARTSLIGGSAAESAEVRKSNKYQELSNNNIFIPLAFETLGPIGKEAINFIREVGRRTAIATDDPRETAFLFQQLSVAVQRFNSHIVKGSFPENFDFP